MLPKPLLILRVDDHGSHEDNNGQASKPDLDGESREWK